MIHFSVTSNVRLKKTHGFKPTLMTKSQKNRFSSADSAAPTPGTLTGHELEKISALIYQRAGIVLTPQKKDMVFNRLSRRLRELNLRRFDDYIALLVNNPASREWQEFINALTTNLTSFFREAYHFPTLAKHAQSRPGMYSVWCAAASTGEEPWSIAMTLEAALGRSITGPRVLATDIDTDVLERAVQGVYRLADIDNLSEQQKKKLVFTRHWRSGKYGENQKRTAQQRAVSPAQPDRKPVGYSRPVRCDFLPQRDDLFRSQHPGETASALRENAQAWRAAVRGSL